MKAARVCVCPVFSVDYNDELDLLVSGSADFSVKVWALSAGACLNTLTGHTEWVTKVRWPLTAQVQEGLGHGYLQEGPGRF